MSSTCAERPVKTSGEVRLMLVDFGNGTTGATGKLPAGSLLTGTPVVTQVSVLPSTATSLTLANKTLISGSTSINGRTCAASEAVKFTAAAGEDGAVYTISVSCATNASPAETLVAYVVLTIQDS